MSGESGLGGVTFPVLKLPRLLDPWCMGACSLLLLGALSSASRAFQDLIASSLSLFSSKVNSSQPFKEVSTQDLG